MIKEGKERIIITLEEPIAKHLDVWITHHYNKALEPNIKSKIVNEALKEWMIKRGDTFDGWKK